MAERKRRAGAAGAAAAVNAQEALKLRIQGHSYRAIAERLGVDHVTVYHAVRRELRDIADQTAESAKEVLATELQRLDTWLAALQPKLEAGDPRAVETAVRLQDRRSRYLGLDAAVRAELTGPGGGPLQVSWDGAGLSDELLAALDAAARGQGDGGGES